MVDNGTLSNGSYQSDQTHDKEMNKHRSLDNERTTDDNEFNLRSCKDVTDGINSEVTSTELIDNLMPDYWPEEDDPNCKSTSKFSLIRRVSKFYRCWTYCYMRAVLKRGKQQNDFHRLTNADLLPIPASMKSDILLSKFQRYYDYKLSNDNKDCHSGDINNTNLVDSIKPIKQQIQQPTSSNQTDYQDADNSDRRRKFVYTLWCLAAPTFIPAGFCQLTTVLCQVAFPLLVKEILEILEQNPGKDVFFLGLPYVLVLFTAMIVNGFGNHRQRHLSLKSGIVMRAAVVNALYEHVLLLSSVGKTGLMSGEVSNLVATDTQKLFEVTQDGHMIWSLPLSILLVAICLLLIMGPTTLIGIAILIMFVPVVDYVTRSMLRIRRKRIGQTDQRIEIITSMLQGIKVTKLNSYEEKYIERASSVRSIEMKYLRSELAFWALTLVLTVISPVVATGATFTVFVLIDESHTLTASRTFTVLLLFSALRFPINFAGRLLGKATQAYSACQRISLFLAREVRKDDSSHQIEAPSNLNNPLVLENAHFFVGTVPSSSIRQTTDETMSITESKHGNRSMRGSVHGRESMFHVSKFNLSVKKGEVLAVCGPVGSGKSILINGIIDELSSSADTVVQLSGRVSYVSQTAFILNNTFRENILFGRPYDKEWYDRVIDACGLRDDIELFGHSKDFTEIGERGVTLSGGQRQRVSLARGIYAKPDLVLLDDPLSALDAGTSKLVFEKLIKGPDALLSSSAVVLVTHASHFLKRVDSILIIVDGHNSFYGTWSELLSFEARDVKVKGAIDHITSSVQEEGVTESDASKPSSTREVRASYENATREKLVKIEDREHGLSSLSTWLLWFKHAGGFYFLLLQILFLASDRFLYVGVEWWLARWTTAINEPINIWGITFAPQSDGHSSDYKFLMVFGLLMLSSFVATTIRSEWAVSGGARAATHVHSAMLTRVLEAPMSYFEETPMGRILNRFTYDTEVIDVTLTEAMSVFMISWSWYIAGVVIMCTLVPWMILAIVPVTVSYWFLLLHYRKCGADLQRLDAVSRSPIQAMVSEAMDGGAVIRLYGQQRTFINRFQDLVDTNSRAVLNFVSAQRWLGFRVEMLGTLISLCSCTIIISFNQVFKIESGLVGMLIIWSSNFTVTLGYMVDAFAESEAAITSIERVDAMSRLPQEKSRTTLASAQLSKSWPQHGQLEFKNVCMRYRPGLPLALNDLSFKIPAGKKCGIVGRTGSGKSSLCSVLFRLIELESGAILVDDIDICTLGLVDIRGRQNGMTIIPQDPFLVGSTLKQCIDPFGQSNDNEILECLVSVRLASTEDTVAILDTPVQVGGSNFSVGERQLLNLARALLFKPKILVLDEATASIDGETDAFIQRMLRTKFNGTTQITVAHRLNTIMDFDYVLVMDQGRASEMGPPSQLLQQNGLFSELVDATGPESSKVLRAMVV